MDWAVHGMALRNNYDMKHFLIKYIHNWLPVGALVSKYATKYPASCPSCPCILETRSHLLLCPTRQPERDKLIIDVRRFVHNFPTDPFLKILVQRVIKYILKSETVTIPTCDSKYNSLIQHQAMIGWEQLFLGRFATEWRELIDDHIKTLPKNQQKRSVSGLTWVKGLTEILYHFAWQVWKERNEDRHGRDKTEREKLLIERALLQTEELYRIRLDVLPRHRNIYYESIEQHKEVEKSARGLQQWISTWGSTLYHSADQAKRYGATRMNNIRQYFS